MVRGAGGVRVDHYGAACMEVEVEGLLLGARGEAVEVHRLILSVSELLNDGARLRLEPPRRLRLPGGE